MRIVFFGSAQFGVPSLNALNASENDLVHIFTQPAHPAGRGRKPRPTPVAVWASQNNLPCAEAENINSPEMYEKVAACRADLLVVIAFGQKIGQEVINCHPKGAINVHASLLPKYRGAAPINRAIIDNEAESGISIITLVDKMDAGLVLGQAKTAIAPDDTAEDLHDRLAQLSPTLLLETIEKIAAGTAVYTPQDESGVTIARKLKKSDGFIDWSQPADAIRNRIRGLWPWPGAKTDYLSKKTKKSCRVTIAKAQIVPPADKAKKAEFGLLDENLNVVCGADTLKILNLKPAAGVLMDFKDFVNGRSIVPGDMFLTINEGD